MSTKHGNPWLEREDRGDVTVIRLKLPRTLDDSIARTIFDPISALVSEARRTRLVVSLAAVDHLESLALGKLVMLNRKVQAANGRMVLCHLSPAVMQTLEQTHLIGLLTICATEEEALKSFA
jgi:anti-anti-sigma factor